MQTPDNKDTSTSLSVRFSVKLTFRSRLNLQIFKSLNTSSSGSLFHQLTSLPTYQLTSLPAYQLTSVSYQYSQYNQASHPGKIEVRALCAIDCVRAAPGDDEPHVRGGGSYQAEPACR